MSVRLNKTIVIYTCPSTTTYNKELVRHCPSHLTQYQKLVHWEFSVSVAELKWTGLVYEYPNFGIPSKHMGGVRSNKVRLVDSDKKVTL